MAIRHIVQRLSPNLDRRWVIGLLVLGVLAVAATFVRWGQAVPPLHLVALGPEGAFQDTVTVPAAWGDTATSAPDAIARFPLVLAVRNPGTRPVRPDRLELSLPVRYRLVAPGEELEPRMDASSPLLRYTLRPELPAIEPRRLPVLLPAYDTLWLEVISPAYYCVSVADSIPEFIAAPPPPLASMAEIRIFYSFEGGDLRDRLTGILGVRLDTTLLRRDMPAQPPSFPMELNADLAMPDLGPLTYGGSRRSRCGEPEDPMELMTTVWETASGGRFIALDYGGAIRKHLYDLDGDGVIERESWDPNGDGRFDATRRANLPIPEFLLPVAAASEYDMARLDSLPPDSLASLDPFRRAMPGPGRLPPTRDTAAAAAAARGGVAPPVVAADPGAPAAGDDAQTAADTAAAAEDQDPAPAPDTVVAPPVTRRPSQPLGRPVDQDTTGGG